MSSLARGIVSFCLCALLWWTLGLLRPHIYKCFCLPESFKASLKRAEDGCEEVCESVCVCVWVHTVEPQWTNNGQRERDRERDINRESVKHFKCKRCKTPTAHKGTSLLHVISLSPLSPSTLLSPLPIPLDSLSPSLPSSLSPLSPSSHPLSPIYPSPSSPSPPLSLPFLSLKQ